MHIALSLLHDYHYVLFSVILFFTTGENYSSLQYLYRVPAQTSH